MPFYLVSCRKLSGASQIALWGTFVEVLISLVMVLVSSSTGCAALREAGLIPTLFSRTWTWPE